MTLQEFLENDFEGYEYVKGKLVPMAPPSMEHGEISIKVIRYLDLHVHTHQLGHLYTAETTFQLGDRVVKPDVAFVLTDRLPEDRRQGSPVPPDLAVEIVSPTDMHYDVTEKALAYLKSGTRLVWVIEPVAKTVMVYRSETDFTLLTCADTLTGEAVVEGFTCPVAQLFE
ncbi:Uma2 family endonuclease [Candidatus Poribacteria bacterium]|nr:Uma2 family endonuclease [Candidatus Poribacteria bacterium]MYH79962.1 Uma2 family endonuclease [Candidatus Poribacteria bacterium]MYK96045.1 Uma2 family endonuclease [Candidatus Poribacteria bacterium]